MKTSFEKFMASSAVQSVELSEHKVELGVVKVDLALIDEIGNEIKSFSLFPDVAPVRKAAEQAEGNLYRKGQSLKSVEDKIAKAKIAMKELGIDSKDLDGYIKMVANQKTILGKLLKNVELAKYIDNV
jgi:hypothetical protein